MEPAMESFRRVEMPAPTAWPIILALGVALLFAGLVTGASVTVLGAILSAAGCVGWFREVLPREKHELGEDHDQQYGHVAITLKQGFHWRSRSNVRFSTY